MSKSETTYYVHVKGDWGYGVVVYEGTHSDCSVFVDNYNNEQVNDIIIISEYDVHDFWMVTK